MSFNCTGFPSKDKTHLKNVSKKLLKPTVLPLSFYGTFMLLNSKRLSEPAVQQGDRIYSKQELRDDTVTLIKAFKKYGVNRGQRLAVITTNFYEGIIMTLAANASGIQIVYFNPLATDEELAADIDKYTPDLLFVYGRSRESVQNIYALASSKFTMVIDYEADANPQAADNGSAESAFKYVT
ncbi:MAG: AMP-binding protein, partial [Clostridia bacterium]|nr:AMP-binding protein [Clostridia bacterium]